MSPIKTLFLGTSSFSKDCLNHLLNDHQFKVEAVITKPPSPSGRHLRLKTSPVYDLAQKLNLQIFTPRSFKLPKDIQPIFNLKAEMALVVAYGKIIPSYFIDQFPHRIFNLHASLLPKLRGAAPIQHALLKDYSNTGVTLQKVFPKLDAGDVIAQSAFSISDSMDALDILEKIKTKSLVLLSDHLPKYLKGEIEPQVQDETLVTSAPKIEKSLLQIRWNKNSRDVFNQIRALVMDGGASTFYNQKRLKIFKSKMVDLVKKQYQAGEVLSYDKTRGFQVACQDGVLSLLEVQLEGRRRQSFQEFINGFSIEVGEILKVQDQKQGLNEE